MAGLGIGSVLEEQKRSIVGQRSAVRAPGSEKDFVQKFSPLRPRSDEGLDKARLTKALGRDRSHAALNHAIGIEQQRERLEQSNAAWSPGREVADTKGNSGR